MASVTTEQLSTDEFVVKVKDLPEFKSLKAEVDAIIKRSSWWDKYGPDNVIFLFGCFTYLFGFYMLSKSTWNELALGVFAVGMAHSIFSAKIIHLSAHGSMAESYWYNRLVCWFVGELIGLFPTEAGLDIHIRMHHPHTNIIGMGDSSTWKAPMLPNWIYMFVAPLLFPMLTPIVGCFLMIQLKKPLLLLVFVVSAIVGTYGCLYTLVEFCGYTWLPAFVTLFLSRAVFSASYIHINIFQHIGLPMYSQKSRPARLYQMSSGVLNLHSNIILDTAFGHSLISCHVEHHLFPRISDNMCMKIKPVVSQFLKRNNLPYNEDSYYNRLKIFLSDYNQLMVNAPPMWHYIGLQ